MHIKIGIYCRNKGTIAKVDANGTQTAYGYVSAINGSTTVTATLNTGNWSGYSGSVRVYIPIRASHYIYAKNLLANFAGYMFLNGVVYTEGIGAQVTQYKGTGVNTVGTTIGLGIDPNAIQSSIESEGGKYPREINVPMGGLGWTYRPTSNTDTAAFSPVDRNTISWTGGEFVIGNMKRIEYYHESRDIIAKNALSSKEMLDFENSQNQYKKNDLNIAIIKNEGARLSKLRLMDMN